MVGEWGRVRVVREQPARGGWGVVSAAGDARRALLGMRKNSKMAPAHARTRDGCECAWGRPFGGGVAAGAGGGGRLRGVGLGALVGR